MEPMRWLSLKSRKEGEYRVLDDLFICIEGLYRKERMQRRRIFRGKKGYLMEQYLNMRRKSIFGVLFVFHCIISLQMSCLLFLAE